MSDTSDSEKRSASPEERKQPSKPRTYKSMFDQSEKSQQQCPFAGCGRKFVSDQQLKIHMERRHKAPPSSTNDAASTSTPIPAKAKIPDPQQ